MIRYRKENIGKRVIVDGPDGMAWNGKTGTITDFTRTYYRRGIPYVEVKLDCCSGYMRNVYPFAGHWLKEVVTGHETLSQRVKRYVINAPHTVRPRYNEKCL